MITSQIDVDRGLNELLLIDPTLSPIAAAVGEIPLRLREPGFAGLAQIIVSQLISKAAASAIWERMIPEEGPLTADSYVALPADAWRTFGLSTAKADTLHRLAATVAAGDLDLLGLRALPFDEAMSALTSVKGIGPWTAEVYLMFCCGHADVFPAGDVALRVAVSTSLGQSERISAGDLRSYAEKWSPWRSVAARLFWAYYALQKNRAVLPI